MKTYGTEFFSMNDVNQLRILQDVIDRPSLRTSRPDWQPAIDAGSR
ncbi:MULTISPECIES: hypothetical protein [Enterobacteriaceae]|nr:hypothetical protein [Raoultella ornithinolytica]BBT88026.1 hypothetical protein WP8W19C01_P12400 [Raoultella ornithinolytica]